MSEPTRNPCPCQHMTPCHPTCTCVVPVSSRGCQRCCTYGSPAQQRQQAERIAALLTADDEAKEREANVRRCQAIWQATPTPLLPELEAWHAGCDVPHVYGNATLPELRALEAAYRAAVDQG